jgi:hypothetical protein
MLKLLRFFIISTVVAFFSNVTYSANLSAEGIKYFTNFCSQDRFAENSLEMLKRFQQYEKLASQQSKDARIASEIVKELIQKEFDESFAYRSSRDKKPRSEEEILRNKFNDLTFEILRNSSLQVFSEFRTRGDDLRLKRRLFETCSDYVNKIIN